MKQSYTEIRQMFVGTGFGNISLELAVGRARVIVKDHQGIKYTLNREDVRASEHLLIEACKKKHPDTFKAFCDKVENLDNEEAKAG
jgi:hypothetical protein